TAAYGDESEAALAYRMADNARQALHIGVTTTRSVGEYKGADFALRQAIESGRAVGPRMFTGGLGLCVTGGHGSRPNGGVIECDGPYEFRKAARGQLKLGGDHVKIMISGGIAGEREAIRDSQMAPDEMEAVAMAAHNAGKKVCAHSGAPAAMLAAVGAGVDCMEHGYFLDDEVAALMVERGTYLVPTICVSRAEQYMRRIGVPEWMIRKSLDAGERHWQALKTAIRHSVKIAMGTDMLPADPNDGTFATYREMELMHEAGMRPMDVLVSATRTAAQVVGAEDHLGTLEPGKVADLIACAGNPAERMADIRNVSLVIKGGKVARRD
ncbi:MAG: metal-dependent hydrolase family protein, partial [Chloroflexota bacterium]